MTIGAVLFGGLSWTGWALALFAAGVVAVCWAYRRIGLPTWDRALCLGLKITALGVLALCLVEPLWSGQRVRPGANLFVILADQSRSLQIVDRGATEHRGNGLKQLLADEEAPWRVRLEQDFDVRPYVFDNRLQHVTSFATLTFDGSRTRLASVLNELKDRFRDRPLAGVLLLTDGHSEDGLPPDEELKWLPPIYPVPIGSASGLKDVSIAQVTTTTTAFEDAPVTVQAEVRSVGLAGEKVIARVRDETGAIAKTESQVLPAGDAPATFRFQLKPLKPGIAFYELEVRRADEDGEATVEATLANNKRLITVDRGAGPYRILYVSGRPNWEFKFLNRSIEDDEQIDLTAMIRIAKKEPKFEWRSRDGEATNPLFRGFDRTDEETERYDQPVIVRLNTATPEELRDGFPKTAEGLFPFHAVLLDDVEADFFSAEQQSLLERFVSERGGGLLMLGGQESFREGKYDRTPVGRMLPVYLDKGTAQTAGQGWRLALSREGWLQPWARLRSTETEEQIRLKQWPAFSTLNRIGNLKPGATVIAEVQDGSGQKQPALAVQRFGEGRCAALLIGDLWRAQLETAAKGEPLDDVGKAWRQMLRWLVADVPERTELRAVEADSQGLPLLRLEVRARDKDFQPRDNAGVTVQVVQPDGTTLEQPAEPSLREPGLYEAVIRSRQSGRYRASAELIDSEGKPGGTATTGWSFDPDATEFRSAAPDLRNLEELARKTGGEVVSPDGLDAFVRSLATREAPVTEATTSPLWHSPWLLTLVVGCLCGEWGVRRWRGLP